MHNSYENLEKRCKKYLFKQRMRVVVPVVLLLVVISVVGVMFVGFDKKSVAVPVQKPAATKKVAVVHKPKVVVKPKKITEKKIVEKKVQPVKQKRVIKEVTYSMKVDESYVKTKRASTVSKKKTKRKKQKPKSQKRDKKSIKQVQKKHPKDVKQQHEPKPRKAVTIKMSVKSLSTIKEMEAVYKKEKKYDLALKIGQKYYEQHNYSKALFWSKEANLLDHKAEGAWILYAKSEYAKGNRKRAIRILDLYRGNTKSPEADSLVMKWIEDMKK